MINELIKVAMAIAELRMFTRLNLLLTNYSHPLHALLMFRPRTFSHRLIPTRYGNDHYLKFLLAAAIRMFNNSYYILRDLLVDILCM